MKTNFLKHAIPMAIAIIGLTSAASTSSIAKVEMAPVQGYKQIVNGPNPCEADIECSNSGNFDCTAADHSQLYAGSESSCLVPLKRDTE